MCLGTESLGVEQFMYRNFLRVRCLRWSDRLIFVTVTWSTCDMVPYEILKVENIFFKVLPNMVPYEMLTRGFV